MPGVPVYSLLLVCVLPIQSAREAAGAAGTRHSPRPLRARDFFNDSDATRREIADSHVKLFWPFENRIRGNSLRIARHILNRHHPPPGRRIAPPDDRLQRAIQYSEAPMMQSRTRSVLDTPLEPVIGLAEGETMTTNTAFPADVRVTAM
jgi:hypothetical protein